MNNEITHYEAHIKNVRDTLGAGDTLFAAFCIKYSETKDPNISALFARKQVESFLQGENGFHKIDFPAYQVALEKSFQN